MKIGMLFSLSGPDAQTGQSILDGALLAVSEVNDRGGVGGRPVEAVVVDDRSEVSALTRGVGELCETHAVDLVVGGYTSASRVAMIPLIHQFRSLLMYPTYFEGEENDSRVYYCGAAPNQYIADYLRWIAGHLGRRVYIVGSDYIYPRILTEAIRRLGAQLDIEIVASRFVPLGETRFGAIVADLSERQPDVVLCNLVGVHSTSSFYQQFAAAGLTADRVPIAATVTTEIDLAHMPTSISDGHYMVGTYFSALDSPINAAYRGGLSAVRGQRWAHPAQVGAYNAVHAACLAADQIDLTGADSLNAAMTGVRFDGNPEGAPFYFRSDHYSVHPSYLVQARDGAYVILEEFGTRVPEPWWSGSSPSAAIR
ncbi:MULTISPECIES: transporter substrate-binding protein [unclassified Gordonia (in: high G+C Gram-positive bacteria)]|uniref:transporter substrate-binding protein n=1 Tax=unclassified Gordonia (in: high G+C Gram-positive bacteria) TaxID=2657482 RepID=UPI00209A77F7|nr:MULTISPECIES: transporter substrate-binding protein [unclassified Gordonia (in: high G+C Gram-positive bacteria)]MDF3285086.1 transporter substrate-binding protein [Gordonia sp. N1V]